MSRGAGDRRRRVGCSLLRHGGTGTRGDRGRGGGRRGGRRRAPAARDDRSAGEVSFLRDEARTVAIAAAGGVVAGAATVAVVKAASRAATPKRSRRGLLPPPEAERDHRQPLVPGRRSPARPLSDRSGSLEIEVRPRSPYRLPTRGRADGVMRSGGGVLTRLLHVDDEPVVVHGWQRRDGAVAIRAVAANGRVRRRGPGEGGRRECASRSPSTTTCGPSTPSSSATRSSARRSACGRGCGPGGGRFAWEALVWAITEQLIEASRAAVIQKRMVRRWGRESDWRGKGTERRPLRDVPSAEVVAGLAPAQLASCDLSPARAVAMVKCAREVADRARRPGRPGRRRPVRAHQRDRPVDAPVPRPLRAAASSTRSRPATSRT